MKLQYITSDVYLCVSQTSKSRYIQPTCLDLVKVFLEDARPEDVLPQGEAWDSRDRLFLFSADKLINIAQIPVTSQLKAVTILVCECVFCLRVTRF